jgi:hypothetical protein
MALRVYGDDRDQVDIVVVGDIETTITSVSRQDELLAAGLEFEAAVSQAALVEGLLLQYLLLATLRGFTIPEETRKRLHRENITFGQVKSAIVTMGAFHDSALATVVQRYVDHRNRMAHHLAAGKHDFDFRSFYSEGRTIAFKLWHHIVAATAEQREANP